DRHGSGRDDAKSRLFDAFERRLDAAGRDGGVAAIDEPEPRADVIVGELRLARAHESRLLANRLRTLPRTDTKQMDAAVERPAENRGLRGAEILVERRAHEGERAAVEFRGGKFGGRWAHGVIRLVMS